MATENFELPSGRPIEIQEFKADTERLLSDEQEIKSGKWLNKFIAKAIASIDGKPAPQNEGELVSMLLDMKTGDRNYLILKVRILNYGSEMMFNSKCPNCGKTSGYRLDLQQMLDDGTLKVYPYSDKVPVTLKTRAGEAEIDYSTGRTEEWLAGLKKIDRIHLAMAMCKKFNGHAPEYKEFADMYARDISEIRKLGSSLKGGLDPTVELDCLSCETSYNIMLYQIPDFFTPLMMTDDIGR